MSDKQYKCIKCNRRYTIMPEKKLNWWDFIHNISDENVIYLAAADEEWKRFAIITHYCPDCFVKEMEK